MIKARLILMFLISLVACTSENKYNSMSTSLVDPLNNVVSEKIDTATFGTGCFWCTEAIFEQLNGVVKVTSGYSGGQIENPTYKQVCSGTTGHAECLNIV